MSFDDEMVELDGPELGLLEQYRHEAGPDADLEDRLLASILAVAEAGGDPVVGPARNTEDAPEPSVRPLRRPADREVPDGGRSNPGLIAILGVAAGILIAVFAARFIRSAPRGQLPDRPEASLQPESETDVPRAVAHESVGSTGFVDPEDEVDTDDASATRALLDLPSDWEPPTRIKPLPHRSHKPEATKADRDASGGGDQPSVIVTPVLVPVSPGAGAGAGSGSGPGVGGGGGGSGGSGSSGAPDDGNEPPAEDDNQTDEDPEEDHDHLPPGELCYVETEGCIEEAASDQDDIDDCWAGYDECFAEEVCHEAIQIGCYDDGGSEAVCAAEYADCVLDPVDSAHELCALRQDECLEVGEEEVLCEEEFQVCLYFVSLLED